MVHQQQEHAGLPDQSHRVDMPGNYKPRDQQMAITVYELQGYSIVLDKIAFVTRVFKAEAEEGYQFNIRFDGDLRLAPQFPTRNDAALARELLIQAIRNS